MAGESGKLVGIDLGTTFSAIATLDDQGQAITLPNLDGEMLTPSAVLLEDEFAVVGQAARDVALERPDRVAMLIKRHMGHPSFGQPIAGRDFRPGDEILVSSLDHDGGVAPWLELAHDAGLVVRHVELNDDTTLDFDDLQRKLGPRTRVVAFAWASNAIGTIVDARRVCHLAHDFGALAWIDAVHYAAHEPIDVSQVGADVLICSPYKFCGPHLGLAYGRAEVIERWRPYKARPAPTSPLGRSFETGTLPYELLAGFNAAIGYLDSVGGFAAIIPYERSLGQRFLDGISDAVTVYGLPGMDGRVPTFLVNVDGVAAEEVAARLAAAQIGVWAHDSWYSLDLYPRLGYAGNSVRIGFIHYNTEDEVDRLIEGLEGMRGT